MNILVTGGAGFIGSHVTDAYLALGHTVVVIDDFTTGRPQNVHPQARLVTADVQSPVVHDLFREYRFELVSHHAALGNPRKSIDAPIDFLDANLRGGVNVLEAARRHGTRKVVFASSGGCAFGEMQYLPGDEAHPIQPIDPYGASKAAFEIYVAMYARQFGLHYTTFRYPNVYGPRQDPGGEAGVTAIFAQKMLDGRPVIVNGDGEQTRDYVFVEDIVRANVRALDRGDNDMFNLGSGRETSVNEIARLLAGLTGYRQEITHGPAVAGEIRRSALTCAHATEILGWSPTTPLEQGLERLIQSMKAS